MATNRPLELDEAMRRRITLTVAFATPDAAQREQIWRAHIPAGLRLSAEPDYAGLAGRTLARLERYPDLDLKDWMEPMLRHLKQRGASRPRTLKTLESTISSLFQKQLPEAELDELIAELKRLGYVTVHERKVTYSLPECDA